MSTTTLTSTSVCLGRTTSDRYGKESRSSSNSETKARSSRKVRTWGLFFCRCTLKEYRQTSWHFGGFCVVQWVPYSADPIWKECPMCAVRIWKKRSQDLWPVLVFTHLFFAGRPDSSANLIPQKHLSCLISQTLRCLSLLFEAENFFLALRENVQRSGQTQDRGARTWLNQ